MTAEQIAHALGGRRCGRHFWACCPLHEADGRKHRPSLQITQNGDKVLVHCWGGCDQGQLIKSLIAKQLWEPEQLSPRERLHNRLNQVEKEIQRRTNQRFCDQLDPLKEAALAAHNWRMWKALCRAQKQAKRQAMLVSPDTDL